jgi:uncharacterized protein YneF (UPF0154 family)
VTNLLIIALVLLVGIVLWHWMARRAAVKAPEIGGHRSTSQS